MFEPRNREAMLATLEEKLPIADVVLSAFTGPAQVLANGQEREVRGQLQEVGVLDGLAMLFAALDESPQPDIPEKLLSFMEKFRAWGVLLVRWYRDVQGFDNEITGMQCRPVLYLKSGEPAVDLSFRSHGRPVLECTQSFNGIISLTTAMLAQIEQLVDLLPSLRPEDLPQFSALVAACGKLAARADTGE